MAWREDGRWRYGATEASTVAGIDVYAWDGEMLRFGPERWGELVAKPGTGKDV